MSNYSYGILASGTLGLHCLTIISRENHINFVLTDKKSFVIIEFCTKNDIPCFVGNPRNGKGLQFIKNFSTDVILSINYLFIIESDIIGFPKKICVNFHGSLLPKYRGRTPHIWAIINNEKKTGITAHLITEGCDEGDIIYQEEIAIHSNYTGAKLLDIFVLRYPPFINKVINLLENDRIVFVKQDETKATWFGKRSSEDGCINWNWHKERIYNWVRALSNPYPGAFTFYKGIKIIIYRIEFCEDGFLYDQANGTILTGGDQPVIKTPNGAVKLISIHSEIPISFTKDELLHERH